MACAEQAAIGLVALFADVRAGRVAEAERRVARDGFVWFVVGARRDGAAAELPDVPANATVQTRGELGAYLRGRARAHDAVDVRAVRIVGPVDPATGALGLEVTAVRRADDLPGGRALPLVAKAQWRCADDALIGLAGHADLAGGPLPAGVGCPDGAGRVAGVAVCGAGDAG